MIILQMNLAKDRDRHNSNHHDYLNAILDAPGLLIPSKGKYVFTRKVRRIVDLHQLLVSWARELLDMETTTC
jgi:hypothetical protein